MIKQSSLDFLSTLKQNGLKKNGITLKTVSKNKFQND